MERKIRIKEPCLENWEEMTPVTGGKFCAQCSKKVFDFTQLAETEIAKVLRENKSVCARIPVQNNLVPPVIIQPHVLLSIKTSFQNLLKIVIILVCLNLTISCQDDNGKTINKPVQLNDTEPYTTTGIVIPPYDPDTCTKINAGILQNDAYVIVDEMPEFKGGPDSMQSFIQRNMIYPGEKRNETAKIFVSFIINEQGKVTEPRIEHKSCENSRPFEREVFRMLKKMPRWIPGRLDGKKVRVKLTLPIEFKPE